MWIYLLEMLNDTKDNDLYHFNLRDVFLFFSLFLQPQAFFFFFTVCVINAYVISISNNSHIVTADKIQMCYMSLQLSENHPIRS